MNAKHASSWRTIFGLAIAYLSIAVLVSACVTNGAEAVRRHRWWSGLGPVLPHDSFPADCSLCHVGENWHTLVPDFEFDHARQTGVRLEGAHESAQCLRCHNDRGPAAVFTAKGCAGCHEDVHLGRIGDRCADCHNDTTWQPSGQIELHRHTRFPLEGVHAMTSCRRCHIGAETGIFKPTPVECSDCHQADLLRTGNHIGLGWSHSCDRCHQPVAWDRAELDADF